VAASADVHVAVVAAEEMAGRGADKGKNQSNNQADSIDERFHNTLLVFCWSKSPIPSRRKPERKSRFYGCRTPPHNALIKHHPAPGCIYNLAAGL
jgi:hypothetical protein